MYTYIKIYICMCVYIYSNAIAYIYACSEDNLAILFLNSMFIFQGLWKYLSMSAASLHSETDVVFALCRLPSNAQQNASALVDLPVRRVGVAGVPRPPGSDDEHRHGGIAALQQRHLHGGHSDSV